MNTYRIVYEDGREITVHASTALEVVKKYNLANRSNVNTRLIYVNEEDA